VTSCWRPRALAAVVLATVVLGTTACTADDGATTVTPSAAPPSQEATPGTTVPSAPAEPVGSPPRPAVEPGPGEYLAGLPATVEDPGDAPAVVVLVPGGGWTTADPARLVPLGRHLGNAGLAVVTITYGTSSTGASWPVPADDVRCAVAFAADQVPGVPVVLVGHSAGAHLSAVAALDPTGDDAFCPYAPHAADALVGLAGPYDVSATRGLAGNLFAVAEPEAPGLWAAGNPVLLAAERPEVPVLLVHGSADDLVGEEFARGFEAALRDGGHPTTLVVADGADHSAVRQPEVVGDTLLAWLDEAVLEPEASAGP
jgi:acetyl esterase/lipase